MKKSNKAKEIAAASGMISLVFTIICIFCMAQGLPEIIAEAVLVVISVVNLISIRKVIKASAVVMISLIPVLSLCRALFLSARASYALAVAYTWVVWIYAVVIWNKGKSTDEKSKPSDSTENGNIIEAFTVAWLGSVYGMIRIFSFYMRMHSIDSFTAPICFGVLGVALAATVALRVRAIIMHKKEDNKPIKFWGQLGFFVLTLAISTIVLFASVDAVNYSFDSSNGEEYSCEVVDKRERHKSIKRGGDSYYIEIIMGGKKHELTVDVELYGNTDIGDSLRVIKHSGALGKAYIEY